MRSRSRALRASLLTRPLAVVGERPAGAGTAPARQRKPLVVAAGRGQSGTDQVPARAAVSPIRQSLLAVVVAAGLVAVPATSAMAGSGSLSVASLTSDGDVNPLGVDAANPRLAWVLSSDAAGAVQSAYQVRVATSESALTSGTGLLWDSGITHSSQSDGIDYAGPALHPATRYFWRVRVWDGSGRASAWSAPAWWETGLLSPSDWSGAQWIGEGGSASNEGSQTQDSAPILSAGHTFGERFTTGKPFSRLGGWFATYNTTGAGFTLTLRSDDGSVVKSEKFTNVADNSWVYLDLDAPVPAGSYVLEMSDPVGKIAWYTSSKDVWPGGEALTDGAATTGDRTLQIDRGPTPSPQLRKVFAVGKKVASARVYISGLGYYVLSIDGKRIGNRVLDPGFTNYNKTAEYATYDVTSAVADQGLHAVGVTLGNGFYGLSPDDTKYWGSAPWLSAPKMIFKLQIDYTDGSHDTVVSDHSWQVHDGPTIRNSVYLGETYDARLATPGWDRAGFDAQGWVPATVVPSPTARLVSERMAPIRVVGSMRADQITNPHPGTYVFRFPDVTAGWAQLKVKGTAGTEVTLRYGEKLRADGTVNNDGDSGLTNGPIQTDRYILSAQPGVQTWQPSFSYKGFQYIQVDGYPGVPDAQDVQAEIVHTDVTSTGSFSSSNPLLNTIHDNTRRTILNNLHSIMTDTPEYEKRGWLGDALTIAQTVTDNFQMRNFYRNWLISIRDNQNSNGAGVDLSPNPFPAGYVDPGWGSALVLLPWQVYQDYGDQGILSASFSSMASYVDYLTTQATDFIQPGVLGDWASPNPDPVHETAAFAPPEGPKLTATAYYYRAAEDTAQAAQVLGRTADAAHFSQLAGQIKAAFNATFLDSAAGVYHTDRNVGYRQASNAIPLTFGLVPADLVGKVAANLAADVKAHGNHLNTGDAGTKELLPALTENGYADVAFAVATQTTYPSWGYQIGQGATTLWERWETVSRSYDHAFEGTIDDWFYRDLAGIKPAAPGYTKITIHPYIPSGLDHAQASQNTPQGTITSAWTNAAGQFKLHITIPANTTATVHVPLFGHGPGTASDGARLLQADSNEAVYAVGSGSYQFTTG